MENYELEIDFNHIRDIVNKTNSLIFKHGENLGAIMDDINKYLPILQNPLLYSTKEVHGACVILENILSVARVFDEGEDYINNNHTSRR